MGIVLVMASLIWFASLDVVDGCLGVLVCSCVLGVVVSLVLVWFCISFCVWAWSGGALLVCLFRRIYIIGVFWMPDFYILRFLWVLGTFHIPVASVSSLIVPGRGGLPAVGCRPLPAFLYFSYCPRCNFSGKHFTSFYYAWAGLSARCRV